MYGILENATLVASAPGGIAALRSLVLELAMRGLLTTTESADTPVQSLLDQMRSEKHQLHQSGQLKRLRNAEPVAAEDPPHPLPQTWRWIRLAEVGYDWGQQEPNGPFTYIDVGSLDNKAGAIRWPQVVSASDASSRARKVVRQGTLIYSTIRPYLLNVAVLEEEFDPQPIASTAFAVIHPYCSMPSRFFFWWLRSPEFIRYVESVQTGIAYPAINDAQFFNGLTPLPPMEEQHRIVAKVDELMGLCDRLEARQQDADAAHARLVHALLDSLILARDVDEFRACWQRLASNFHLFRTVGDVERLKQATVQLAVKGMLVKSPQDNGAVEDLIAASRHARDAAAAATGARKTKAIAPLAESECPFVIPESWRWARLGDIAAVVDPNPSHRMPRYVPEGIPFVSTENFSDDDSIDFSIGKKVAAETLAEQESKFQIRPGAFALSRIGTIGKTRPLPVERTYCLSHALCVVSPYLEQIDSRFLRLTVTADNVLEHAHAGVQSIGVPDLGVGTIRSMPIPIPPPEIQAEIVAQVDAILTLCDQLKATITRARAKHEQLAEALVDATVT